MAIALTQSRYAFRSDTLTVDSASFVFPVGENTTWVPSPQQQYVPFRIRFEIFNNGSTSAGATTYRIFAQKNGTGGYTQVNSSRTDGIVTSTAATTDTDNTLLTVSRLTNDATPGTPAFVNGEIDTNGATANITLGVGSTNAQKTELEFCLMLTAAAVPGDFFDFRVYRATSTALNTYTVTPRVSVTQYGFQATNLAAGAAGFDKPAPIGAWTFLNTNAKDSDAIETGTSAVVTAPLNIKAGDLILCALAVVDQAGGATDPGTITLPDGTWTQVAGDFETSPFNGNLRYIIAYKTATGSEPASYTFTWTNTSGYNWWINTFTPPTGNTWSFDAGASNKVNTSGGEVTSWTSASLSGLNSDKMDIGFVFSIDRGGQANYTVPGALFTLFNQNDTNADYGCIVAGMLNPIGGTSISALTFTAQFATSPTTTALAFHSGSSTATNLTASNLAAGGAGIDQPAMVPNDIFNAANLAAGGAGFDTPLLTTVYSFTSTNLATGADFFTTPGPTVNRNLSASNLASGAAFLDTPLPVIKYNTDSAINLATGADGLGVPSLATIYPFTAVTFASGAAFLGSSFVGQPGAVIRFPGPGEANNQSPALDNGAPSVQSIVTYSETAPNFLNQSPVLDGGQVAISSVTAPNNFLTPGLGSKAAGFSSPALVAQSAVPGPTSVATGADFFGTPAFGQAHNLTASALASGAAHFDAPSMSQMGVQWQLGPIMSAVAAQFNMASAGLSPASTLTAGLSASLPSKAGAATSAILRANALVSINQATLLSSSAVLATNSAALAEAAISTLSPTSSLGIDARRIITPSPVLTVSTGLRADIALPQSQTVALSAEAVIAVNAGIAIANQSLFGSATSLSASAMDLMADGAAFAPSPLMIPIASLNFGPRAGLSPQAVLSSSLGQVKPNTVVISGTSVLAASSYIFEAVSAGLSGTLMVGVSEKQTHQARIAILPTSTLGIAMAARLPVAAAFAPSIYMVINEFLRPGVDIFLDSEAALVSNETMGLAVRSALAPQALLLPAERMLLKQTPFMAVNQALLSSNEQVLQSTVLTLVGEAVLRASQPKQNVAGLSAQSASATLTADTQHALAGISNFRAGIFLNSGSAVDQAVQGEMAPAVFMDARVTQFRVAEISAMITGQAYGGKIIAQGNLIIEVD